MKPSIATIIRESNIPVWQGLQVLRQIPTEVQDESINVLAVDGDILAYRTAAVCQDAFEGACSSILDTTLREISTDTGVHHMRIYLSGTINFRHDFAKTKPYKGNRVNMVRPQFLEYCKQYLVDRYKGIRMDGYEADDGIATDMTINGAMHCGIDKDMLQVPGKHYNYVNKTWREVGEEEALLILYRQVLMGDNSDNIPGLPKVGEKTAEKVLQNFMTVEEDARNYYIEVCRSKLPEVDPVEYMAEQYGLIRMVCDCPIDFDRTIYVEPNTEGFQPQEGTFQSTGSEPRL